jgi:hypothetical protein
MDATNPTDCHIISFNCRLLMHEASFESYITSWVSFNASQDPLTALFPQ